MRLSDPATRNACLGCLLAGALLFSVLAVLPAPEAACSEVGAHWAQLNAWPTQALLRPLTLLLQGC